MGTVDNIVTRKNRKRKYCCTAQGCDINNVSGQGVNLSFFQLPKDKATFEEWCKRLDINIPFENVARKEKVCQRHFETPDWTNFTVRLKPDALPHPISHCMETAKTTIKNISKAEEQRIEKLKTMKTNLSTMKKTCTQQVQTLNRKIQSLENTIDKLQVQLQRKEDEDLTEEIIDRKFKRNKAVAALVKKKLLKKRKPTKLKIVTRADIKASVAAVRASKLNEEKMMSPTGTGTVVDAPKVIPLVNGDLDKLPKVNLLEKGEFETRIHNNLDVLLEAIPKVEALEAVHEPDEDCMMT